MKLMKVKWLFCFLLTVLLGTHCFGQTNVNSSTRPAKKETKQKPSKKTGPPDLDLTGVDELLRDMKEWPHVGSTRYSLVYYGAKTIKRTNGNVIRVWTKTTLKDRSDETKSEFLRSRQTQGLRIYGYENFSHSLELGEYHCTRSEGRLLSRVDYDVKGNVIDSASYRNPPWDYIVPNSIGESILKVICGKPK